MSQVYVLEPPTNGKVLLRTTLGDLDIELWPKEAPKAVRNFVQLALEGYFDGCTFHRVVKGFICQTGDPTNTGEGPPRATAARRIVRDAAEANSRASERDLAGTVGAPCRRREHLWPPVRGRVSLAAAVHPARPGGHGQLGAQHEPQPVLYHL